MLYTNHCFKRLIHHHRTLRKGPLIFYKINWTTITNLQELIGKGNLAEFYSLGATRRALGEAEPTETWFLPIAGSVEGR